VEHENGAARAFYAELPGPARVGMEATFDAQWFERLLAEYHHELWVGGKAQIRAVFPYSLLITKPITNASVPAHSFVCWTLVRSAILDQCPFLSGWGSEDRL